MGVYSTDTYLPHAKHNLQISSHRQQTVQPVLRSLVQQRPRTL
jgi:hypothetical protein